MPRRSKLPKGVADTLTGFPDTLTGFADEVRREFPDESEANVQRRARQLAIQHLEETQHKGVGTLDSDLAGKSFRSFRDEHPDAFPELSGGLSFATRKDGRVYRKEAPVLDVRGLGVKAAAFDRILGQYVAVARKHKLPDSYGYHLVEEANPRVLQARHKLTDLQVRQLKGEARDRLKREES